MLERGTEKSQIRVDLESNSKNEEDKELIEFARSGITKISPNIETFPNILDPEEIQEVIAQVTETIDQKFIRFVKENKQPDINLWNIIKKKIRLLPTKSLIQMTRAMAEIHKIDMNQGVWSGLEDEFARRLQKMTFIEIIQMLWCFAYANRANREFFRKIENELYDRSEWKQVDYK